MYEPNPSCLDFECELGTLPVKIPDVKSLAKKAAAKGLKEGASQLVKASGVNLSSLGLPPNIPGIGDIKTLYEGIKGGSAKQIVTAVGGEGGSIVGNVFGGPVGGMIGEQLGHLLGGVVPKTKKEKRKAREATRSRDDLLSLSKFPLTDDNIVKLVESGQVVFSNSTDGHGWDVPGQPLGKWWYQFVYGKDGKTKKISYSDAQKKPLFLRSNVVSKKSLASYSAVKDNLKSNTLAQAQNDAHMAEVSKKAIAPLISRILDNQKTNTLKLTANQKALAKALANRALANTKALAKLTRDDHVSLGKISKANNTSLSTLAKSIQQSSIVPNRFTNLLGGQGLFNLIKETNK